MERSLDREKIRKYKNISYDSIWNVWKYQKQINKVVYKKHFKSKNDCLWFKFTFMLMQ